MRKRTIKNDGPDPIDSHVGRRVQARRKSLQISQTKLGEAIGVTFQQVQKYENGMNRIGASNLYKVAKFLGVDPNYFFDCFEEGVEPAEPQPRWVHELVGACQRLPEDYGRALIKFVRTSSSVLDGAVSHAVRSTRFRDL